MSEFLPAEKALGMYKMMYRIRKYEESIYYLFLEGIMPGTIHQSTGEEASAVGMLYDLRKDDWMASTHRPAGHDIAKGISVKAMMCEMFGKAEAFVNQRVQEAGEQATFDTGIHDLHPELVRTLGRLRYRTSYGQNVLNHSIEVSHLAGLIAAEIGADVTQAKRAGLLHDLGKSIDHEVEGSHVQIGVELARKYRENEDIVHAIEAHHNDVEPRTIVACIVQAADAISAARPGARRENLENYIKRLEKLEEVTSSFPGVEKSFAIQAGREVRIMVAPDKVSEDQMVLLARDIAKKIEEELEYPGQIKVNMIRETKVIEYAK